MAEVGNPRPPLESPAASGTHLVVTLDGEQRLVWVFSTLLAQSGLQLGASLSDRVKNSDGADDSPNTMVTTFGQIPGGGVFSAKLETHIGQMNHSPHLHAGLPGISPRRKGPRDGMQKSERSTGWSHND